MAKTKKKKKTKKHHIPCCRFLLSEASLLPTPEHPTPLLLSLLSFPQPKGGRRNSLFLSTADIVDEEL